MALLLPCPLSTNRLSVQLLCLCLAHVFYNVNQDQSYTGKIYAGHVCSAESARTIHTRSKANLFAERLAVYSVYEHINTVLANPVFLGMLLGLHLLGP